MESNGDPVGFKNGCIQQADGSVQEAQRYGNRTEAVELEPKPSDCWTAKVKGQRAGPTQVAQPI